MVKVIFSRTAVNSLRKMELSGARRIVGVLERIRIKPERYTREMVNDPAFRLTMDLLNIYIDISGDDIIVLWIN